MSRRSKMLLRLLLALVIVLSMGTVAIAAGAEQEPAPEATTEPTTEATTEATAEPTTEPTTEPAPEHTHNWVIQHARTEYHALLCTDCYETKQEAHTLDDAEICTVCGKYAHMHNWQRVEADDRFHTIVCSGCQESKTVTHSYDGQRCTVCGYEKHEHIWQYNGEIGGSYHNLECTVCGIVASENHIYGEDGSCTVCGAPPPHVCQWECHGEQDSDWYHILECACGNTRMEDHERVWDGVHRDRETHGLICRICGDVLLEVPHYYDKRYVNGERCTYCGYETVKHSWKYGDSCDIDRHTMVCTHCDSTRYEAHKFNSKGKCTVCGYQDPDAPEQETKPKETKPAGTEPTEAKETKPAETEAAVTEPTEETPEETKPAETEATDTAPTEEKPEETKPAETEAAETAPAETVPENAADEEVRSMGSPWIWAAAGAAIAGGLGAAVFFRKKNSA